MAIRIVTDSVSNLSPAVAQADDITVVPLYVNIGRESYRDGLDITAEPLLCPAWQSCHASPSTSQPSVADFRRVYQRLLDQGHQVVSIHVSARLSGTLNSAKQAKVMLGEAAPIEIVDSPACRGRARPAGAQRCPVGEDADRLPCRSPAGAPSD